jgi:hypothetical protein
MMAKGLRNRLWHLQHQQLDGVPSLTKTEIRPEFRQIEFIKVCYKIGFAAS